MCAANPDNTPDQVRSRYQSAFSNHYPSNLCDIDNSVYLPTPTGNIGLAAGGTNPSIAENPNEDYVGGDITFGGNSRVEGSILAGNNLVTTAQLDIHGLVSAGSFGASPGGNVIGASTTIDIASDGHFTPTDIPNLGAASPVDGPVARVAAVLWSRPL